MLQELCLPCAFAEEIIGVVVFSGEGGGGGAGGGGGGEGGGGYRSRGKGEGCFDTLGLSAEFP